MRRISLTAKKCGNKKYNKNFSKKFKFINVHFLFFLRSKKRKRTKREERTHCFQCSKGIRGKLKRTIRQDRQSRFFSAHYGGLRHTFAPSFPTLTERIINVNESTTRQVLFESRRDEFITCFNDELYN